jgi:hypothetical protein
MPSPHWYTTFAAIGAVLGLRSCIGASHRLAVDLLTGVFCGATFVFLQPAGALLCLAVGFALAWDAVWLDTIVAAGRRVGALALGALVPIVSMYGYFAARGALDDMVRDTILWNMRHYRPNLQASYGESNLLMATDAGFEATRLILMVMPPVVIVAALIVASSKYIARRASLEDRRLFALAVCCAGFVAGNYYYPDVVHLAFAAPPAFALLAALGSRLSLPARSRVVAQAAVVGLLACASIVGAISFERMRTSCSAELSTPRGTIDVHPKLADYYEATLSFLETQLDPGEPFYVYPYGPGYHFLSGHPNAAPIEGVNPFVRGLSSDEQIERIVSALKEENVRFVLVSFLFGRRTLERYDSELERYIRKIYHVASERPFVLERDAPGRIGEKVSLRR